MKKSFLAALSLAALMTLGVGATAFAAAVGDGNPGPKKSYTYQVFSNATTGLTSPKTSRVFNFRGWDVLMVAAKGETLLGNASTLQASGATIQCQSAPTPDGPWSIAFEGHTELGTIARDITKRVTKEQNYMRFISTKARNCGSEFYITVEEE